MKKPSIAFVSESRATYGLLMDEACDVVGGAELQQALLASALRGLGYSVSFIVGDFGQPRVVVTEQGITLVKGRRPPEQQSTPGRVLGFFGVVRAMGRAGADIYYQRTSDAVTGVAALFCSMRKKPFIFSVASDMNLDGSARSTLGCIRYALYRYGLKHAAAVVVQTEDQMRLLKENFGRDGVLIRSAFSIPEEREQNSARKHILWVGNCRPVKRPEWFLEVAARLPGYEFVAVGGAAAGSERLFDEISAKAEGIPNLHLAGPVPYAEVGRYFSEAAIFVNTSSAEGFPNTYLQAWCRGVPVVATFDPDGLISRHGLGRSASDVDGLVQSIRELMEDESLRTSIGERAAQYVREHHSLENAAESYDRLFMGL